MDPFFSAGKLTTGGYKHFPVREYLGFTSEIDMDKLGVKLEEFNRLVSSFDGQFQPMLAGFFINFVSTYYRFFLKKIGF